MEVYFDQQIDIHHIFPQAWCRKNGVDAGLADSIVNKTPLAARTNRVLGGSAPSQYVSRLEREHGGNSARVDHLIETHFVAPEHLRADDFEAFYSAREAALLAEIESAMGKPAEIAPVGGGA